jgi:hypothetical protein
MADAFIQSALTLPKIKDLEAANAIKPAATLTVPNPSGGIRVENGIGVFDAGVDIASYARRDSELQWRDIAVGKAVEMIARRATTVFGAAFDFPSLPFNPEVSAPQLFSAILLAGTTTYSTTLVNRPIIRGKVEVLIGSNRTVDDGRGRIVASDFIVSGTIDYVTGALTVNYLVDNDNVRSLTVNYATISYLAKNSVDLNPNQLSFPLGGATGVEYVSNQSEPRDAVVSDQDLYRRDLVLYQVLVLADQIFNSLAGAWDASAKDPTIPAQVGSGGGSGGADLISDVVVDNTWSRAQAQPTFILPDFGRRWGPEVFADADKYNAWRDNVLALYAAELSRRLTSLNFGAARLQGIGTEDGIDIRVEDGTTVLDAATPAGAGVDSEIVNVALSSPVSQSGVTVTSTTAVIAKLQIGDKIVWPGNSATVYAFINATSVKAFPSQVVGSSTAHVERDTAIFDPPRVLRVEPPVWVRTLDGYFAPFETAQRLYVRVSDSQLTAPTLQFTEVDLEFNPAAGPQQSVLRFYDTEYSDLNGAWSFARLPRHEAEIYQLTAEDSRYRTFAAQPFLPNGTRAIVYDRVFNTVRWYPHLPQDFMPPVPAGSLFIGTRQSQEIEILATAPYGPDAEHWRQKAAQIQANPCHERTIEYRNYPQFAFFQADSGAQVVGNQPTIFTTPGITRYENFSVFAPLVETRAQWMQFNFLIAAAKTWYRHGNTWSFPDIIGAVSVGPDGMTLPPASNVNAFQNSTNSPKGAWKLNLPVGSYTVAFEWVDLNTAPVPLQVTIRLGTQILFSGLWTGLANAALLSNDIQFSVPNSNDAILSLTVNSPITAQGIRINRFRFTRLGNPVPVDYRVNVGFYDTDPAAASEPIIPTQYGRFRGVMGSSDVLSTDWIDIATVGHRTKLNCQVELLDQPAIPFSILGIELRTRIRIEPSTQWPSYTGFKEQCLYQALEGIQAKYAARVQPNEIRVATPTGFTWNSDVTTLWLNEIASEESRISSAFRPARPGDIGRPALVPSGVYFDGLNIISLSGPVEAVPILTPWQPWMMPLGFLVAMEDFWVVDEPPRPVKLTIIDPTGEDSINFDPNAPNLDFTKSSNSQYVPLL